MSFYVLSTPDATSVCPYYKPIRDRPTLFYHLSTPHNTFLTPCNTTIPNSIACPQHTSHFSHKPNERLPLLKFDFLI
jgi:hypothetical protein